MDYFLSVEFREFYSITHSSPLSDDLQMFSHFMACIYPLKRGIHRAKVLNKLNLLIFFLLWVVLLVSYLRPFHPILPKS